MTVYDDLASHNPCDGDFATVERVEGEQMSLNERQRKVVVIGASVLILMGLFPPWIHTFKYESVYSEESAGYSFIALPPQKRSGDLRQGVVLDTVRLLVQCLVVMSATGLGVFLGIRPTGRRTSTPPPLPK